MNILDQYNSLKIKNPQNCILFFRIGEFYEIFFHDAKLVSEKIGIALTSKKIQGQEIPMCGIPHKAKNNYISILLESGYKVSIAEQFEDLSSGKLIARDVVRVFTPGTVLNEELIRGYESRYLIGIIFLNNKYFISIVDISSGNFEILSCKDKFKLNFIINANSPKEIITLVDFDINQIDEYYHPIVNKINLEFKQRFDMLTDIQNFNDRVYKKIYQYEDEYILVIKLIFEYIKKVSPKLVALLKDPHLLISDKYLEISLGALNGLEIFQMYSGRKDKTIFTYINRAITPLGKRMMREFLIKPLNSKYEIDARLDAVEYFITNKVDIFSLFGQIGDIERVVIRIASDVFTKEDFFRLKSGFNTIISISQNKFFTNDLILNKYTEFNKIKHSIFLATKPMHKVFQNLSNQDEYELLNSILKTTFVISREVAPSFDYKIQEAEELILKAKEIKEDFFPAKKIKISLDYKDSVGLFFTSTNKNFDLIQEYLDVTKTEIKKDCIIFTTGEIDKINKKFSIIISQIKDLELKYIQEVKKYIIDNIDLFFISFDAIAKLDIFYSFSKISKENNYTRPIIAEGVEKFKIIKGKHPLISSSHIVANDCILENDEMAYLITGPNMGGKSTFLKQNAIIAIMAHMGCFVPAEYCEISIIDKIFARIGSNDLLSQMKSSFYIEIEEMSEMIKEGTNRSLCIIDELCKGTSPEEGMIITEEILKYLTKQVNSKVLFSTHYHGLQDALKDYHGVKHFSISMELDDSLNLMFTYKLSSTKTSHSHSCETIKKINMPQLLKDKILSRLERIT